MRITSPVFENGDQIPEKYTCDGQDINPPLKFEDIPEEAMSLALIVSDPDTASAQTFYHWVLFNMDAAISHIDEDSVPASALQGMNDFGNTEYSGPCPPGETHRYVFTLYALDETLKLSEGAGVQEVLDEMEGHIIDTAQTTGVYSKS